MIIAVASGKGGTGKTTVSANLARAASYPVQLLDCDVEEPNARLFVKGDLIRSEEMKVAVPEVDASLCDGCGQCSDFCRYHAIVPLRSEALVFPELCHGCGGCMRVCPKGAITEVGHRIGIVETFQAGHITLVQGCLDVGKAMAPPLIREVKARLISGMTAILDAPPGTSCPVIASIRGADLVVLVTEPTPFGLHDLKLAVDTVQGMGIPFGAVINRVGIGDGRVHDFCRSRDIPVLFEIPDDREIAEAYSRGELMVDALPEYRVHFQGFLASLWELRKKTGSVRHAYL